MILCIYEESYELFNTECLFPTPVGNNHLVITNPHFFDVPYASLLWDPFRQSNVNTFCSQTCQCHLSVKIDYLMIGLPDKGLQDTSNNLDGTKGME